MNPNEKTYEVQELFYSLKGEGAWTGYPMFFVRLAGCNLNCNFCDTVHDEPKTLTVTEIINEWKKTPTDRVVITGGEPTLQDLNELTKAFDRQDCWVHIETNGTNPINGCIHWICVSPKNLDLNEDTLQIADEIKFPWTAESGEAEFEAFRSKYEHLYIDTCERLYLLPIARSKYEGNKDANDFIDANVQSAIEYIKLHPNLHLSLCHQLHKCLNIK